MSICLSLSYRVDRKKMSKTFSYNFGCLAVIIRLLFNPLDALWLWHRIKRFVIVVYFKIDDNSRDCFEGHSASCHDLQQSFDPCLHVCWHLRHRPCASWLRRRLCETDRQSLRPHSLCAPHEAVQKLSIDCFFAEPFWNTQQ